MSEIGELTKSQRLALGVATGVTVAAIGLIPLIPAMREEHNATKTKYFNLIWNLIGRPNTPDGDRFMRETEQTISGKYEDVINCLEILDSHFVKVSHVDINDVGSFIDFLKKYKNYKPEGENKKQLEALVVADLSIFLGKIVRSIPYFMDYLLDVSPEAKEHFEHVKGILGDLYRKHLIDEIYRQMTDKDIKIYRPVDLIIEYKIFRALEHQGMKMGAYGMEDFHVADFDNMMSHYIKDCYNSETYDLAAAFGKLAYKQKYGNNLGRLDTVKQELDKYSKSILSKQEVADFFKSEYRLLSDASSVAGGLDFNLQLVIFLIVLLLFLFVLYQFGSGFLVSGESPDSRESG